MIHVKARKGSKRVKWKPAKIPTSTRRCTMCNELGHNRRTCSLRGTGAPERWIDPTKKGSRSSTRTSGRDRGSANDDDSSSDEEDWSLCVFALWPPLPSTPSHPPRPLVDASPSCRHYSVESAACSPTVSCFSAVDADGWSVWVIFGTQSALDLEHTLEAAAASYTVQLAVLLARAFKSFRMGSLYVCGTVCGTHASGLGLPANTPCFVAGITIAVG
jgi:hypothetical protein